MSSSLAYSRRALSTATSSTTRKVVERVRARVFCHSDSYSSSLSSEDGGGNPVTIFSSPETLSPKTQEKLAKECDWESVMVPHFSILNNNNNNSPPPLSFYMPSGEQVSFCAHAAMGAAMEICLQQQQHQQQQEDPPEEQHISFTVDSKEYWTSIYDLDIVALEMKNTQVYQQTPISQPSMLYRMLRDYCGLETADIATTPRSDVMTSEFETTSYNNHILCHGSIARPKTLVPLWSVDDLHKKATAPSTTSSNNFALACKALDDTTGLYLYAKSNEEDGAWHCRQFPRASGYAEDPATGIAAAALACHLYHHHEIELPVYKLYQGSAMGKPSLIVVDQLAVVEEKASDDDDKSFLQASFRLLGRVEMDERDTLEVDD
ncbi:isomerase, phenazine biosynthesis phzc phzf domain [Seminavis robusta]|uniref:Isomerase, phenazine biosynthesis phzc phzf domain n=1 Tax=Seminavis robusta TaxID=568900 RepID=A0A9N8EJ96_9STRA|nr:isomerase, phenazine biosynthesis phzc phzf domain [Seminavis robusta]|eukprot:Sro1331_g263530.1 isomerase, phenazine biosynthesis phzc phzf domain (377) ;mRNA; r:24670-25800